MEQGELDRKAAEVRKETRGVAIFAKACFGHLPLRIPFTVNDK
jgi:hypothetical protein